MKTLIKKYIDKKKKFDKIEEELSLIGIELYYNHKFDFHYQEIIRYLTKTYYQYNPAWIISKNTCPDSVINAERKTKYRLDKLIKMGIVKKRNTSGFVDYKINEDII